MKDRNGNILTEGQLVIVQLDSNHVQGHIEKIIAGGASLAIRPDQPNSIIPTQIVVMCPVVVTLHPQLPNVPNVAVLLEPAKEPTGSVQ